MPFTIHCPQCHVSLRANKTPPADTLIECLHCGYRFTFAEATRPRVSAPETPPIATSANYGSMMMSRVLIGGMLVVALMVGGLVAAYHSFRPDPLPLMSVGEPIAEAKPEPKPDPVAKIEPPAETKVEPKIDLKLESDRELFTHLMIDGGIALQLKKFDEAIDAYTRAQRLFPDNPDPKTKLADAHAGLEIQEKAKREADQIQADAAVLVKRGLTAIEKEQYVAAIEFFKLALQKSPANEEAAELLLRAQARMQKADAERKKLDDFDRHLLAGRAAMKAGQPADAIREFMAANRLLPNDPVPGELLKEAENLLPAKIDNKKDPPAPRGGEGIERRGDVTKLLALAQNAVANQQLADAANLLREAEKLMPNNPDLIRALRALELIQANQAAYYQALNQATNAMALRMFGDAVLAYAAALQIVPNDPLATVGLLEAQRRLAQQNARQREYDLLVVQGLAALRNQRFFDARTAFQAALALVRGPLGPDPQVERLYRYSDDMIKGYNALNARQFITAGQYFQAALAEIPNDPAAFLGLQKAQFGNKGRPI